jgi:transcription initiation factor TFIIB
MKTLKNRQDRKKLVKDVFNIFEKEEEDDIECVYTNKHLDNKCNKCDSTLFISDEGFYCCSNHECGKIVKDVLDFGAEWRFYGADDANASDPARCGMPIDPLLKESSFGCKIFCGNNSSHEMRKIRRVTEWQAMPYNEKSKYDDSKIIEALASQAGIPKIIINDAIRYYHKISVAKTYRGLNRDGLLAASIYIACSINENPRTAKEIATIFKLDNTSATRGCKNAVSILNDLETDESEKTNLVNTTPSSFIDRYCSKLSINQELTQLCLFIANIVETRKLIPENTPHSISAGIIYFVCQKCNLNVSKKSINSISKISEVTINKCFKKLETYETQLIPRVVSKKYMA